MPCTSLILQSIPSYNSRLDEMLRTGIPSGITPSCYFYYNNYHIKCQPELPYFSHFLKNDSDYLF